MRSSSCIFYVRFVLTKYNLLHVYNTGHPLLPLCSDYLKSLSILADLSQVPSHDNLSVTLLWQFILVPIYMLLPCKQIHKVNPTDWQKYLSFLNARDLSNYKKENILPVGTLLSSRCIQSGLDQEKVSSKGLPTIVSLLTTVKLSLFLLSLQCGLCTKPFHL
jgi:hypothetical protein